MDDQWFQIPGGGGVAEVGGLGGLPRDRGPQRRHAGSRCCTAGTSSARRTPGATEHPPLDDFRRLTRDLYIAPGEIGFWQGAFRDPDEAAFAEARAAIEERAGFGSSALRRPRARPAVDHALLDGAARGRRAGSPPSARPLERRPPRPALSATRRLPRLPPVVANRSCRRRVRTCSARPSHTWHTVALAVAAPRGPSRGSPRHTSVRAAAGSDVVPDRGERADQLREARRARHEPDVASARCRRPSGTRARCRCRRSRRPLAGRVTSSGPSSRGSCLRELVEVVVRRGSRGSRRQAAPVGRVERGRRTQLLVVPERRFVTALAAPAVDAAGAAARRLRVDRRLERARRNAPSNGHVSHSSTGGVLKRAVRALPRTAQVTSGTFRRLAL